MFPSLSRLVLRRLPIPTAGLSPGEQAVFDGLNFYVDFRASVRVPGEPRQVEVERPLPEERDEMPKASFYAVAVGRAPGIYGTWAECQKQIDGFSGAKFKKFGQQTEAQKFIDRVHGIKPASSRQPTRPDAGLPVATRKGDPLIMPERKRPEPRSTQYAKDKQRRTRDDSPLAAKAPQQELPDRLAKLSRKGYMFTNTTPPRLIVYTDGSGLSNGTKRACAGAGVYWGEGEAQRYNLAERVPGPVQTNNRGELLSIIRAIEACPFPDMPIEVRTDSQYSIQALTVYLPKWLKNGWRTSTGPVKNSDMIRHLLVLLRRRAAPVRFKHVRGHSGHAGNDAADELARAGAIKPPLEDRTDWLDPDDDDVPLEAAPTDIAVDIDPSWLMSEAEVAAFERSLESPVPGEEEEEVWP